MTAVETVITKIKAVKPNQFCSIETILEWCEQAKEMEKQQMRRIYEGILQNVGTSIKQSDLPTFEEYYNHTFKK